MLLAEWRQHCPRAAVFDDRSAHLVKCKFCVTNKEIWVGGEYGRDTERTRWTGERVGHLATNIDRRFDEVGGRFDRVEGDLKELRQLVYYLWGSMLIGFLVVIATVLLGHH
jgi:hypothetical protein